MFITTLILLLLSNVVTLRRDKSILFSRVAILILIYSSFLAYKALDILFVIDKVSEITNDHNINILYLYISYFMHLFLIIILVGFLFKVNAVYYLSVIKKYFFTKLHTNSILN